MDRQFLPRTNGSVRKGAEQLKGLCQMCACFPVGGPLSGVSACFFQVGNGLLDVPCFRVMMGKQFGCRSHPFRESLHQYFRYTRMQVFAPASEQCIVGGLTNERMLELIGSVRRNAAHVN